MPCIVEMNDCNREPMWYCCNCGDGPLNCGVVKKCLDIDCGHEYANCDRQNAMNLESREKHDVSLIKKHSRRKDCIDIHFQISDSDSRILGTQIANNLDSVLRPFEQADFDTISDRSAVEAAISPTMLYESPSTATTPQSSGSTFSSCTTTPFSESSSLDLCSIIDARVEYLIERILGVLYIIYNTKTGDFVCTTCGDAPPTSSSRVSLGSPETSASIQQQCNSRSPLKRDRDDHEDEGGEDSGHSRKQPKKIVESQTQKYACVFLKRRPTKYMHWPSCGSVGWRNVARLKEHLYRRHRVFLCWRCSRTFQKECDLQKHAREEDNCMLDESYLDSSDEGIDPETEKRLRNRRGQSSLNENEKWKKMYGIVFGVGLGECPSPYFDPNEFKEGRFRGSVVDHVTQHTDHYRRDIRRRLLGPLSDILRRHLTHAAETDIESRSNSVDSLVLPITEDLIILLTHLASSTTQLSSNSDDRSERSGVDSITSTFTAAPEGSLKPPDTMKGTDLRIGNIDLRNSLEGSWAVTTRDITASPFPTLTYNPEISLQNSSYRNRSSPASPAIDGCSSVVSHHTNVLHHGLDDTLTLDCPTTEILEPEFLTQKATHNNTFPEHTESSLDDKVKSQSLVPSFSAIGSNRDIRALAATKGMEFIDDTVFDPRNLVTGLSSSIDTFADFETLDTHFGVFELGDWETDFTS